MKVFKSRFRKWFINALIKAYHAAPEEDDVIVITFDEKYNDKGDPVQKFYYKGHPDLELMQKTGTINIRPFEEYWANKNRSRLEHLFLKFPNQSEEMIDGDPKFFPDED